MTTKTQSPNLSVREFPESHPAVQALDAEVRAHPTKAFRELLDPPEAQVIAEYRYLLAADNDDAAGLAVMRGTELYRLYAARGHEGKGVGRALFEGALKIVPADDSLGIEISPSSEGFWEKVLAGRDPTLVERNEKYTKVLVKA